jgi:hypothetical protein
MKTLLRAVHRAETLAIVVCPSLHLSVCKKVCIKTSNTVYRPTPLSPTLLATHYPSFLNATRIPQYPTFAKPRFHAT